GRAKKVVYEHQEEYTLVVAELDNERVVICFSEGDTGHYYAKVVPERSLSFISCNEIEYLPTGLYAFSRDPLELAQKCYLKSLRLSKRVLR
ncbi:MAG: hypothetical protein QXV04_04995, partial [Desulfurococcaceae archaeon]